MTQFFAPLNQGARRGCLCCVCKKPALITAKKRENMGAKLTQNSVCNTFHQQFINENNVEAFKRGNFTDLISQQTLRPIKSDVKSRERFSNDDSVNILETQ